MLESLTLDLEWAMTKINWFQTCTGNIALIKFDFILLLCPGISLGDGNQRISPIFDIIFHESLLLIQNQYLVLNLMPECRKWYFRASRFQIFVGEHVPTALKCYSPSSVTATYFNGVCCLLQSLSKPLYLSLMSNT